MPRERDASIDQVLRENAGPIIAAGSPCAGDVREAGSVWFAVGTHVPWRPLVVLCPDDVQPARWMVFGKLEGRADVARPLALSASAADLREELRLRGYERREGWIREELHTGLEIHERKGAAE